MEREGALLLARRRLDGAHGGLWELPGGKLEEGEGPEEALLREIREEFGLGARILGPARRYDSSLGSRESVFFVLPLALEGEPSKLAAHEEIGYFRPAAIPWSELAPLDGEPLRDWLAGRFRGTPPPG